MVLGTDHNFSIFRQPMDECTNADPVRKCIIIKETYVFMKERMKAYIPITVLIATKASGYLLYYKVIYLGTQELRSSNVLYVIKILDTRII